MADDYGMAPAMAAMLSAYSHGMRGTGRTTRLVERVREGDVVLFARPEDVCHFEALCIRVKTVGVRCVLVKDVSWPGAMQAMAGIAPVKGRVFLDHGFVERYYRRTIEQIGRDLSELPITLMAEEDRPAPVVRACK